MKITKGNWSGWELFAVAIVFFIIYAVTKFAPVAIGFDIFFPASIIVGIWNWHDSRKSKVADRS